MQKVCQVHTTVLQCGKHDNVKKIITLIRLTKFTKNESFAKRDACRRSRVLIDSESKLVLSRWIPSYADINSSCFL